jgi:hypothetical protein
MQYLCRLFDSGLSFTLTNWCATRSGHDLGCLGTVGMYRNWMDLPTTNITNHHWLSILSPNPSDGANMQSNLLICWRCRFSHIGTCLEKVRLHYPFMCLTITRIPWYFHQHYWCQTEPSQIDSCQRLGTIWSKGSDWLAWQKCATRSTFRAGEHD